MTFEELRAQFPVLERIAYLNAGSMGPLMRATGEAMIERTRRDVEDGRGGKPYFDEVLRLRAEVRSRIAALLGVTEENVALTASTTDSCNVVLAGFGLRPEDEVVTTDSEHPGLLLPLNVSGARVVVAPTTGRPSREALETILSAVTPRTRLLALSHVAYTTGHVLPVHELKAETGLPVLVDGAQSVGAIPVEAREIDFYTVSCQKWLCGPEPIGALYVREPDALRIAAPSYFSQASMEKDGRFEPKPDASRFDSGWVGVPALAGLVAALDAAPDWRYERSAEAASRCRDALAAAGFEVVTEPGHAALVSFVPHGDPAETVARLYEEGVVIRDLPGTGWCRVSCGWWTSDGDIERLVAALAKAVD
ncbi:MAG: aminotransferase class V-fold PLP-dependent enzyme [Actinobacteria bacterium]|nr:MAG: aminotransferase class V-fold PLP-dependent enzyme [Actinomycetota bacterium]